MGPNAAAWASALEAKIMADNGVTDYNAAFAQSDHDNPGAQARIFLTDGGHNVGTYNNGHLTHKVPTYVIGFSAALAATEDKARLEAIASETGGSFYPLTDSSSIQSVMNSIGAAITCQTPPQSFTDKLKAGASKTHAVTHRREHQVTSDRSDLGQPAGQLHDLELQDHKPRQDPGGGRPQAAAPQIHDDDQRRPTRS